MIDAGTTGRGRCRRALARAFGFSRSRLRMCFLALFFAVSFSSVLHAREDTKRILMIHSYHWGMSWTDGQVEGFMQGIRKAGIDASVSMEQMDVVTQPAPYDYDRFADYLIWRHGGRKFDLIVTTDTDALKFVALKYNELFAGTPVIFSDVYGLDDIAFPPGMAFTGVKELRDYKPTIDLARQLRPDAKKIVIFGNKRMSGAGPRLAQDYFENSKSDVEVEFHLDRPFEDIVEIAKRISPDDIVFSFAYAFDETGTFRSYNDVRDVITDVSPAPMFHFWQATTNGGIGLGGKLSTAREQGLMAANLGVRVLDGEDPRAIPLQDAPTHYVFEYDVMKRLGIDMGDLPEGAIVQNRPRSIYDEFRTEIWSALAVFALLIVIIVALLRSIARRKTAESALIENEERFREFASLGADWFWESDENLRFSYISDGVEETFGLRAKQILGKSRQELFEGKEVFESPKWRNHVGQLARREPFANFEMVWTRPDGETRDISISGKPVVDQAGAFKGYRGVGRDMTVLKSATKRLQHALEEAELANSAKSEFMAKLSHEFRTPLNAILGFSEMMRERYFGPLGSDTYDNYVGNILFSARHMLSLVDDVLDIAAIESGELHLDVEEIDVREAVENCVTSFERAEILGGIELVRDIPDGLAPLRGDSRAVSQIILNLLSNAVKFTAAGGRVTISARETDDYCMIDVSDTGAGIPADRLRDVTKPFTQATSDPHKAQEGAGLGLAIVKALIDSHVGELHIVSTLGEGTTVTVSFPRNAAVGITAHPTRAASG